MQIFDPIAGGNTADATDGCQLMSHSHAEKDIKRKKNQIKS